MPEFDIFFESFVIYIYTRLLKHYQEISIWINIKYAIRFYLSDKETNISLIFKYST